MFNFQQDLIAPHELKRLLPLNELVAVKEQNDKRLLDTIKNKDKFIIVCGPCAADNYEAVVEYCRMLRKLSDSVSDKILLVPRIFTAKPRSMGEGYLGMLFQHNSEGTDINNGLIMCRKLFIDCMNITGLPIADELLYIDMYEYFDDLISYYFVGARTSESTPHRNFASGIDVALGIKNAPSGNLKTLAEALYCVRHPKICFFDGKQYLTTGNRNAHIVLRGQMNEDGSFQPNCNKESLERFDRITDEMDMSSSFVLVDCSHANSGKNPKRQIDNARYCVKELYPRVGGIMLESYIYEGNSQTIFGASKTDACLSFEDTKALITELYELLPKR